MHIDLWTLLLQAVNLAVLLALLRWLFYRPLIAVIDARRKAVGDELAKAEAAHGEAVEAAKALAVERAALDASRTQLIEAARGAADTERETARKQAEQAALALLAEAREGMAHERRTAQHTLLDEAAKLAGSLAARWLTQTAAGPGDAACVDALLARAGSATDEEKAGWFAADMPRAVAAVSAHALEAPVCARVRDALHAAFGEGVQVGFEVDPALVSGAELRFPHGVLALHWAGEAAASQLRMQQAAETIA